MFFIKGNAIIKAVFIIKINLSDTICAIATAPGGAISIVRMSGPRAEEILCNVFFGGATQRGFESHKLYYGYVGDGDKADEVLAVLFRAPRSYTREDVVEISCHGGVVSADRVLSLLLSHGARLAMPGEFTRRAFVNGRIDLSQAEAVNDILSAKTEQAQKMALNQLNGYVSGEAAELRELLKVCFANIEACVDYPENDIEEITSEKLKAELYSVQKRLHGLVSNADKGEIIRDGVETVIIGRPNVGKSSLMNALLRRDRVIVTDIAGTTRDTVREYAALENGILLHIADTAGIRDTDDVIERAGVERSLAAVVCAQLVLVVLDGSEPFCSGDREVLQIASGKTTIALVNKSDKPCTFDNSVIKKYLPERNIIRVSALKKTGLGELSELIMEIIFSGGIDKDMNYISNKRHKAAFMEAESSLRLAIETLESGHTPDWAVIDMENAYRSLSAITGDAIDEDICDSIFSEFCLGK